MVLRWQYHRGSTLFLVWTQHRQASIDEPGPGGLLAGARGIAALPPDNTLLLKLSYWLDW